MTSTERAINELKRAGLFDKNSDYDGMIGDAVKDLLMLLSSQGHSGHSASITVQLFHRLVDGDVLSPLTNDPSEWMEVLEGVFQNKRCFHVFKEKEKVYTIHGKIFSDDGGKTFVTTKNSRVFFDLPAFPPEPEKVIL